jgi:predicted porin
MAISLRGKTSTPRRISFQPVCSTRSKSKEEIPMKKAAALLGAAIGMFAGTVVAQSTVNVYGLIDLSTGKYDGTNIKTMGTGATSFLGFRGSEDLGGGWRALFQLENQISPDTGAQYNSSSFYGGRSTVGLEGSWGRINLGRDVNASYYAEALSDPFGENGLPSGYGSRGGISQANGAPGLIETVRTNNSVNYYFNQSAFTFRAQTAAREGSDPTGNIPFGASLIYAAGPLQAGVAYINPSKANDHWAYGAGNYDFGPVRIYAGIGGGQTTFKEPIRNQILGVAVPIGVGLFMGTVSHTSASGTTIQTRTSLGYYYFLSKRTSIYSDVVYDPKAGGFIYGAHGWAATGTSIGKTGYDAGIRHFF